MSNQFTACATIAGIAVPPGLLGVVHARKSESSGFWTLTTKKGVPLAMFPSEPELETWWESFQESQGRIAQPSRGLVLSAVRKHKRKGKRRVGGGSVAYVGSFGDSNLRDWDFD
jgi:hypothetical protein